MIVCAKRPNCMSLIVFWHDKLDLVDECEYKIDSFMVCSLALNSKDHMYETLPALSCRAFLVVTFMFAFYLFSFIIFMALHISLQS